jgi:hypothetical protein
MSRYTIALKKTPKETEKDKLVTQFGFDQDIKGSRRPLFFVREKEIVRVGILFDDPTSIFYCSKVHYYKSHRFFCKSIPGHMGYCCQPDYPGRKPVLRIATILVQYYAPQTTGPEDKVLPWVFGSMIFDKLKQLNEVFPVDKHDILVKCPNASSYRFKQYEVMPSPSGSLWQDSDSKNRILEVHSHLKRNIRSYFAEDYSDDDIRNIISQPETTGVQPILDDSWRRPTTRIHPISLQLNQANIRDFIDDLEPRTRPADPTEADDFPALTDI